MKSGTYAELHGSREEFNTGSLGDLSTTLDTGQVDESRLDNALLALSGLDNSLGEAIQMSVVSSSSE